MASQPDGVAHATPGPRTLNPEPPRRWPLAARRAEFASFPSGNERAGLGRDLFRRLSARAAYTLALTAVLFFALPRSRLGQTDWCGSLSQPQTLVGFTDKVNLGEMGEIGDSPERGHARMVLRLLHQKARAGLRRNLSQRRLLAGLPERPVAYGGATFDKGWAFWSSAITARAAAALPGSWYKTIRLEAVTGQELFYVSPFISLGSNYEVQRDCGLEKLLRVE